MLPLDVSVTVSLEMQMTHKTLGWLLGAAASVLFLGMGLAACGGTYEADPYEMCCGCLAGNHCIYDTPSDVGSVANWCRGELESGVDLEFDEACVSDLCSAECEIL
jgi:hypothetical protein